jgi:hypothetical protein
LCGGGAEELGNEVGGAGTKLASAALFNVPYYIPEERLPNGRDLTKRVMADVRNRLVSVSFRVIL